MIRNIYNKKEWILCICTVCKRLNYVEPHGTTAQCKCSPDWTEHVNIPYAAHVGMAHVDTAKLRQLIEGAVECSNRKDGVT